MTNGDRIYSTIENQFVDVLGVSAIYVFNDFPNSDAGTFVVVAVVVNDGWVKFEGNVSEGWTLDGLERLCRIQEHGGKVVKLGYLHETYTGTGDENKMWMEMWDKVLKRAEKFAKTIKYNQDRIMSNSLVVKNY